MIRKLWAKFDGLDVACVCNNKDLACQQVDCEEYMVKFTPVNRITERRISKSPKQLEDRKRTLSGEMTRPNKDVLNGIIRKEE